MRVLISLVFGLVLVGNAVNLIPTYQSGYIAYDVLSGASLPYTATVTFSPAFTFKPQVIISWSQLYAGYFQIAITSEVIQSSITTSEFQITISDINAGGLLNVGVFWFAFLDDHIYTMAGSLGSGTSSDPITTFSIPYDTPQTTTPSVLIFTTGIGFSEILPFKLQNFVVQIGSPTNTGVDITITTTLGYVVNFYSYSFIYANPSYLTVGQITSCPPITTEIQTKCCTIFSPNMNLDKIYTGVGLNSYITTSRGGLIDFTLYNNAQAFSGQTTCSTNNGDATFKATKNYSKYTSYQIAYFQYFPCPLYCVSCNTGALICDGCIVSTHRSGASCTCTGQYYDMNQNNCGSCLNICNGCSGTASNCNACNPTTNRINPPNCDACAANYTLVVGVDNCQPNIACNSNCNGCVINAEQCTLCSVSSGTLRPPFCMTCANQTYYQISSYSCQNCNGYCLGCQTTSSNCFTCLASTLRSNPPDCLTCPINMFIQVSQVNCQSCDQLCNQCTVSANNCVACIGLYRTNSPQCNQCSKSNYYIDSSSIDCQPCASFCNGCVTSSINCIACWPFNFGQLTTTCYSCPTNIFTLNPPLCSQNISSIICNSAYNRDPTCNCLTGFYNSDNQLSCLKCSSLCQTCTSSANNCTICNSQLQQFIPPTCNSCKNGEFILYGNCSQCSNICITCIQSSTNCLTCISPRISPPQCICPNGYFNDCSQQCGIQCYLCSVSATNCLFCSGNRINPPLCSCPDGSIQPSATCSNCSIAAPTAQFSNDLNSINIVFQYPLNPITNCNAILNSTTLISIGVNPQCSVNGNTVILILGTNASISIQQLINFNQEQLQFSKCNTLISTIIPPIVQSPQYLYQPKLLFNSLQFTTTACDNVLINIIGSNYSGQRNLQLLGWIITRADYADKLNSLAKQWNQLSLQPSYTIASQYLQNQSTIELLVNYQNFIGQQSSQLLTINVQSQSIQLQLQVPQNVYVFDIVKIIIGPSLKQCQVNSIDQKIIVSVIISNETLTTKYNYTLLSDSQQSIIFNPFQLTLLSNYQVSASAQLNNLSTQVQQQFLVIQYPIKVLIQGGDQQIGINQILNLTAQIFDPNLQTQVDIDSYNISWQCQDLVTLQQWINFQYLGQTATLNTTGYQTYKTLLILIQAQKQLTTIANNNITISIIENQVSQIQLKGNQYQLNTPINTYDEIDVTIQYQNPVSFDVDKLTYQASYLNSAYQKSIIQLENIQTSINGHFFDTYSLNQNVKFQVTVNNPALLTTSVSTQNIFINIPPSNCKINIYPKGHKHSLQIESCISNTLPLQYQFVYYLSKQDFIQDSINGLISNGIELNEFQISPTLLTYLSGQNTSMIVGRIKDSQNGLSNTSISLSGIRLIDSTMFNFMLIDNSLNLPNNVLLVLMHIQTTNETLSQYFSNKLQQIVPNFNQSSKITKRIQQYSQSYQSLSTDQILSQLQIVNQFVNEISSQLTDLQTESSLNRYNKDFGITELSLEAELLASAQYISFLYGQSQQGIDTVQNITYFVTQGVANITNILGNLTKVNQNQKAINTTQFNISAQKFSTEKINSYFGLQIINQSNQTVIYKNQNFKINPYQNYTDFANPVKAPLIIPNLTDVNTIQIKPPTPIPFTFPFIGDIEISCASQIGDSWSLDVCQVVKSLESVQCLCQTLSPLSIKEALEYILSQFAQLFNHLIVGKINSFPYWGVAFTYIIATFIVVFFTSKFVLHRKDLLDNAQVHPVNELPKFNSIEDVENNDNNQFKSQKDVLNSVRTIQTELYTSNSLIAKVNSESISKKEGFITFLQNSHVIFELYYRFDSGEPRILRLNTLFLEQFGKICIFVLFGKNLAISIVIGLSLFQTAYGILFQLILSKMMKSKNKRIHNAGVVFSVMLTGFCTYLIVAAMSLYPSAYPANIAALSYLASFVADYFITNIAVEFGKYMFVIKFCDSKSAYKIFGFLLPPGLQEIVFGRKLAENEAPATKEKI